MVVFRRALVIIATGTLGFTGFAATSFAQSAPTAGSGGPSDRVGRLAFLQGTVSFHDNDQSDWQPALLNTPITAGDALWTEPNAHSEVSIAGTRVRMDSATQLDMVALDDRLTRMELEQGRIDIKTFSYDTRQPYEVVTPRGIVTIQQQGDYYVEAGSMQDPTRLGVRQGAAQLKAANGQTVAVRAGEVVELSGDGSAPQLTTIKTAPPPMPTYWAERDRQVAYDKPPQYLSSNVTGYEDLSHYGTWKNDPQYGQVWYVNAPPSGWAPYTTGRWVSDPAYGWTWVDEQPWGFAPYHYGRWAQRDNRWFWVPPDRQQPAVYAPALVGFLGGVELGNVLGAQNRQPVGWFPLGPREVYVPPYSMNRDYYRRLNMSARVQQNILDDRWQRYERREALRDDDQRQWMNRRFARVVPADDFARSRPVQRSLIQVAADKLAAAPVAAIAAPPRPTESIRALTERRDDRRDDVRANDHRPDARPGQAQRPDDRRDADRRDTDRRDTARPNEPVRAASAIGLKPEPEKAKAPGPQIAARPDARAEVKADAKTPANAKTPADAKTPETADRKDGRQALPQLAPRNASAPPQPKLEGDRRPLNDDKRPDQANAPQRPDKATAPNRPDTPDRADKASSPPNQSGQATLPPVRDRNDKRPETPQAGDQRPNPNQAAQPKRDDDAKRPEQAQRPGEPPKPNQAAQPKRPDAEPAKPQQADPQTPRQAEPPRQQAQPPRPAEPPKPNQAAEPRRPDAEPAKPQQAQPQAPHQAEPPRQQAQQPQRPVEPPKPQAPQPQPQPQQPKPERQGMNAPAPQPQHQVAPQPQRQAAPQPQQHQAAPQPQRQAAPQPQHQAVPQPQPQRQASPQPQPQRQAPQPQPQQAQAPRPTPQPQQQAQAPAPQPHQQQGQHNNDKK